MTVYAPTTDPELKEFARQATGYTDTNKLTTAQLDTLVKIAKMRVKNDVGSEQWYSDEGLGQVLTFTLCIGAKSRMENHYLGQWSVGDQNMSVRDASQEDSAQYQEWNDAILDGLDASSVAGGSTSFQLTSNYNF